jgi:hypothetical protein
VRHECEVPTGPTDFRQSSAKIDLSLCDCMLRSPRTRRLRPMPTCACQLHVIALRTFAAPRNSHCTMVHTPRVFTIPASAPFLPTLIRALLGGRLVPGFAPDAARDPLALAGATIYLPTRRACRLARDVFLDVSGVQAAILPRIVAIGDVDEDEIIFAQAASGEPAEGLDLPEALDLPDALGGLERRLLLTRLVLAWAANLKPQHADEAPLIANHPATALALADDLARLIDDMTTRGVSWDRLDDLVPDHLDRYWQLTLVPENRPHGLAGYPGRAPHDRAGGAPRRADQGRGGAA